MADAVKVEYDRADIRLILRSFKAMSDEAIAQSKKMGFELATFAATKIRDYAVGSRFVATSRVANNVRVSKSSKIGEFAYGFKSQKLFSGGASTFDMVGGLEFGSKDFPQFPTWKKEGYFIYPTLKRNQPEIIGKWEQAFDKILKEF